MDQQQQKAFRGWAKLLNPAELKANLLVVSLFLAAYEMLMSSVVGHLRDFFCFDFSGGVAKISDAYRTQVLSLHKSRLRASLLWFKNSGVINDADIALVKAICDHRNELAHELPRFLGSADANVNIELLGSICELITKIDRWWIREVEIPTNPEFDDIDTSAVPDSEIASGRMALLHLMITIATGDDAHSSLYYDEFVKTAERSHPVNLRS